MNPEKRPSATRRGYDHRWREARASFLREEPLCRKCKEADPPRLTPATVVDHVIPHKGNQRLFWDRSNWAGLCTTCHSAVKQREERRGYAIGCDASGAPLDPKHRWNREQPPGGRK